MVFFGFSMRMQDSVGCQTESSRAEIIICAVLKKQYFGLLILRCYTNVAKQWTLSSGMLYTVLSGRRLPKVRNNILPPSSGWTSNSSNFAWLSMCDLEDGDSMFLRNILNYQTARRDITNYSTFHSHLNKNFSHIPRGFYVISQSSVVPVI